MNGWVAAMLYIIVVGIANVFWKLSAHLDVYPAVYVSQGMLAGGFGLLLLSKPSVLVLNTFRHINTWLYGLFFFIEGIIAVMILHYIDTSTSHILNKSSLIILFLINAFFIKWPKNFYKKLIGIGVVFIGIIAMLYALPNNIIHITIILSLALGLTMALRTLAVQAHKPNSLTKTMPDEILVTGTVMSVSGLISYIALILISTINIEGNLDMLPTHKDIFNVNAILISCGYGLLCFSVMRYLEFYSIKKIGSINFLAALAFLAVSAYFFEYLAHILNWVPMRIEGLSPQHLLAFGLMILGSLFVIYSDKSRKRNVHKLSHDLEQDRKIALHTLEFSKGNHAKAAKLLSIPEDLLTVALTETDPDKALPEKISKRIQAAFTNKVAFIDGLTGLINKTHFLSLFKAVLARGDKGVLLYMDLNKFKPVNDTYGHEAGDEVLRITAQRLMSNTNRNSIIARLGGDEFAVLLTNISLKQAQDIKDRLVAKVGLPMNLESINDTVDVGASFGMASYPDQSTNAEELLHLADQNMYKVKRENS